MSEVTVTCDCGAPMAVYGDRLVCLSETCGKTAPLPPAYEVERRGGKRLPGMEG